MNLGAVLSDRVLNGDFLAARDGKIAALSVGAPPEAANAVDAAGSLGYRPPSPETIVLPSWPPGSATLRRPTSLAEKPAMH